VDNRAARPRRKLAPKLEAREQAGASVSERIYAELKDLIVDGSLPPGAPIDKNDIRRHFNASLSPVTAAISRLGYEKLVVIEPQRGSFVAPIMFDEIVQFMALRRALEVEAVCEATKAQVRDLGQWLQRNLAYQEAARNVADLNRFYELDVEFHRIIIEASGLWKFNTVLDEVRAHLDRVRLLMLPVRGRMEGTLDEHRDIAQAIASKRPAKAEAAMRTHLDRVDQEFRSFAEANPKLVRKG
jgi:GntR family transcriptional regulator, rspAB operon transcriptional repressor